VRQPGTGQSRFGSAIETCVNIAVGWIINYGANLVILPAYGFTTLSPSLALEISLVYTVIAIVRGYGLRRLFNWWGHRHKTRRKTCR
jgi:hypothetical protein